MIIVTFIWCFFLERILLFGVWFNNGKELLVREWKGITCDGMERILLL